MPAPPQRQVRGRVQLRPDAAQHQLRTSPLAGFTNFSIAMVFKSSSTGLGAPGVPWYNGVGVMDGDEPGALNDWGTALDASGDFIFGVGNPDCHDVSGQLQSRKPPLPRHCYDLGRSQPADAVVRGDKPATVLAGLTLPTGPRDNANIMLGGTASPPGARTDPSQIYIAGEFAEVQFYSGALTGVEATNLINSLQSTYGLLWPDQALCSIAAARTVEDIGSNIVCTVTIPLGVNASHSVTVTVTSSNPGAVTVGGGGSTSLTFAAGATNIQTFSALTVGAGSSTLTASSPTLISGSVTISVLAAPALVEAFRASSLTNQVVGIADGDAVVSWYGDTNALAVANQTTRTRPRSTRPPRPAARRRSCSTARTATPCC